MGASEADAVPGYAASQRTRILKWLTGVVGVAVVLWFVPLFHVVPLQTARDQAALGEFDAAAYVDRFWDGTLRESAQRAPDAIELLLALRRDFAGAADRLGHRLGLGGKISFLVSGAGRIVEVDGRKVMIALRADSPAEIVIRTGPVFGNAIRDGSGLFDVSEFANVQHFNAISAEINRRVEARVLPALEAHAEVGTAIRFAGGVEVTDSGAVPALLNVVPLLIDTP